MGVEGYPGIWALGDCAMIPDEHGGYQPPTAQHASREGKVLAHNIVANSLGKDLIPFRFNTLGLLASIGRRTGVARILGVNFSGFLAWWLWHTIYLLKLPRVEKKVRVALDWTLDVFFSKDFVQYLHQRSALVVNTPIPGSSAHSIDTDPDRFGEFLSIQRRLDGVEQCIFAERLAQEIHRTSGNGLFPLVLARSGGDKNDRNALVGALQISLQF
jgi:hypothetical protein